MIRISRPPEPVELQRARHRRLAQAFLSIEDGIPVKFLDYDVARKPLHDGQGKKCAYCERQQGDVGQPVEHFRPKGGVESGDPLCYYWLAWTWENLLFACTSCNSPRLKGNKFPLEPGTSRLPRPTLTEILSGRGPAFQVDTERPLLVDPSRDDPLDHIAWRPENPGDAPDDLRWRPVHKTPRGEATIKILFRQSGLEDHVESHIRLHVNPRVRNVRCAMAANDHGRVLDQWNELLRVLFSKLQPYHAASYDALDYWIPALDRQAWGLALPRPGKPFEPHPSCELVDPPKLAQMPDRVRLEVRADRNNTDQLVLMLCSEAPWREDELADVLGRAPGSIAAERRKLVTAGQIRSTQMGYVAVPTLGSEGDIK